MVHSHLHMQLSPRLVPFQIVGEYEQSSHQAGTSPPRHNSPGASSNSGNQSLGNTPTRRARSQSEVIPIPRGEPKPQPSDPVGIPMSRTNTPHLHQISAHHSTSSSFSGSAHEGIGSSASSLSPPHYLTYESRMTSSGPSTSSSASLAFRPRAFDSLSQRMSGAAVPIPTSSSLGGFESRTDQWDTRPATYRSEPSIFRTSGTSSSSNQPEFEFYAIEYDNPRGVATATSTSSSSAGMGDSGAAAAAFANRRSLLGSTESMSLLPTVTTLLSFDALKGEGDDEDDIPFDSSLLDDPEVCLWFLSFLSE